MKRVGRPGRKMANLSKGEKAGGDVEGVEAERSEGGFFELFDGEFGF